jgi:hypothetical protein
MLSTDSQFVRPADRAKHSGILLVLELALTSPAALPSTSNNKLHPQLAEHLRQPRPGRAVPVVLDALRIVA